jgi:hypothetical protein
MVLGHLLALFALASGLGDIATGSPGTSQRSG